MKTGKIKKIKEIKIIKDDKRFCDSFIVLNGDYFFLGGDTNNNIEVKNNGGRKEISIEINFHEGELDSKGELGFIYSIKNLREIKVCAFGDYLTCVFVEMERIFTHSLHSFRIKLIER